VSLVLDYPLATGDEAFFGYGGRAGISNDRLLLEYGFVEENNPDDTHRIPLVSSEEAAKGRGGGVECVVLGRRGAVRAAVLEAPPKATPSAVTAAVSAELARLRDASHVASGNFATEAEQERWQLASAWRREKIRLLDEHEANGDPWLVTNAPERDSRRAQSHRSLVTT
jgi:hypothetical protein